jgi:hypothetical protein
MGSSNGLAAGAENKKTQLVFKRGKSDG